MFMKANTKAAKAIEENGIVGFVVIRNELYAVVLKDDGSLVKIKASEMQKQK